MSRLSMSRATPYASSRAAFHTAPSVAGPSRPRRPPAEQPDNVDLVAPPDSVSNIRPMIYSRPTRRPTFSSPYSSAEFPYAEKDAKMQDLELEWRLRKERLDMMNHRFWAATNNDFQARLSQRLSTLPPFSEPPTEDQLALKEEVLSQFYADWLSANKYKQIQWVRIWWRELWGSLRMDWKMHFARMTSRFRR